MFSNIFQLGSLMNQKPEAMYQNLMKNNPQFSQFVNSNRGKTPQQILQENGITNPSILNLFK